MIWYLVLTSYFGVAPLQPDWQPIIEDQVLIISVDPFDTVHPIDVCLDLERSAEKGTCALLVIANLYDDPDESPPVWIPPAAPMQARALPVPPPPLHMPNPPPPPR